MSIIKAQVVEIEIQEQTDPDAAAHWMTIVKYSPEPKEGVMEGSVEIAKIILTDHDPIVRYTKDLGDKIVDNPKYGLSEKEELYRQLRRKEFQTAKDN